MEQMLLQQVWQMRMRARAMRIKAKTVSLEAQRQQIRAREQRERLRLRLVMPDTQALTIHLTAHLLVARNLDVDAPQEQEVRGGRWHGGGTAVCSAGDADAG
jgi:hypothetical protein